MEQVINDFKSSLDYQNTYTLKDLQKLLEELFSEIEIPDPVGYGEVEINPEDLQ